MKTSLALLLLAVGFCSGCATHFRQMPTHYEPQGYSDSYHHYLHEFDPEVCNHH